MTGTSRRTTALAVLIGAVAVVHAVVVGRHYFVGSFDDDASYIAVAQALAHGFGLTHRLPQGVPLIATYPPGFAALLVPIAIVDPSAFTAMRAVPLLCLVGLLILSWHFLRRWGLSDGQGLCVLALLALNPVLATFSTMVMAELPFLVVFVVLLVSVERWAATERTVTWSALATIALAAGIIWIKEAAAGMIIGLVLWLVLKRLWRKAAVTTLGVGVLMAPVVIGRIAIHSSLLGSRYSDEFGVGMSGGLAHQITAAIPHALSTYVNEAFPQTIAPTSVSPLPIVGPVAAAIGTLGTTLTPLVLIGFAVWAWRRRDAVSVMVPVYLAETLVYPFINERRLVLFLPVLLAWFVLGATAVIDRIGRLGQSTRLGSAARLAAWAPAPIIVALLVPQFGRDYLFALGQDTSRPQGSPYMALLQRLGPPGTVVETDYVWTTNLFSHHPTNNSAYLLATHTCYFPDLYAAVRDDGASYFLSGQFSSLGSVGSPCLLQAIGTLPGAVRLFRTRRDDATVFELTGPGTPNPDLTDLTATATLTAPDLTQAIPIRQAPGDVAGTYPIATAAGGVATFTWTWSGPEEVRQLSLGAAGALQGATGGVQIQALEAAGWTTIASAPGAVGGAATPFLLAPESVEVTAVRVVVDATGPVSLLDFHALGSPITPRFVQPG